MEALRTNPLLCMIRDHVEAAQSHRKGSRPEADRDHWALQQVVWAYDIMERVAVLIQRETNYTSAQREELEWVVRYLHEISLPGFILGMEQNPLHHNLKCLENVLIIAFGENRPYAWVRTAAIAALLHDFGNGFVDPGLVKVTVHDIKQRKKQLLKTDTAPEQIKQALGLLISQAKAFRNAHMVAGVERAKDLLERLKRACDQRFGYPCLQPDTIQAILDCIAIHDAPTIGQLCAELGEPVLRSNVIPPTDTIAHCVRQGDRGWMVTRAGLDKDLLFDLWKNNVNAGDCGGMPQDESSETYQKKALDKLRHNVRRFREEYELYEMAGFAETQLRAFRGKTLFCFEAGFQWFLREITARIEEILGHRHRVNIAASLGGTKLAIAAVFAGDIFCELLPAIDWKERFGIGDEEQDADALKDGIVCELVRAIRFIEVTLGGDCSGRIGISCKGPMEIIGSEKLLGPGKKMTTLPFRDYPLEQRVREDIEQRLHRQIEVELLHDGVSAILGEVARGGTIEAARNAMAMIIGTGVGAGILVDGEIAHAHYGSLGRFLVRQPPTGQTYTYSFRTLANAPNTPIRDKSELAKLTPPGVHFSERIAGPWLAPRVARECEKNDDLAQAILKACGKELRPQQIKELANETETPKAMKTAEKQLLVGITEAARVGCQPARDFIQAASEEIGTALAEFVKLCGDVSFVKHIVLVSSIGENLGRNVEGMDNEDLFMSTIRQTVQRALASTNLPAEEIAQGIVRSTLSYQREFLAFTPE